MACPEDGPARRGIWQIRFFPGGREAITIHARTGTAHRSSRLNLDVPFHTLLPDGVFVVDGDGPARFAPLPPPRGKPRAQLASFPWKAGESLHREGTPALKSWVEKLKERLYGGDVEAIIAELRTRLARVPVTGPGNKGRRERLEQVMNYLETRRTKLNYAELIEQDLEIGSGPVGGAVKHIIAARIDHGGTVGRSVRPKA